MINIEKMEMRIGYTFKNKKFAQMALTHKSYAHDKGDKSLDAYNERVEFLGDAVLEFVISKELYNRLPNVKEGELTKKRARIVCEKSLCDVVVKYDLSSCLMLGNCELKMKNNKKDAMLADMFEAILGAIYLDGGLEVAEKICLEMLDETITNVITNDNLNDDCKTRLQEEVQKSKNTSIEYVLVREEGPAHNKDFYVEVYVNGKKMGEGNGKSKKEAQQKAAKQAYENIQN